MGMDAVTREHAFEPFFTTKATGTGLGLATVYGIVQQCGGHICLDIEAAQGTVFKVYLPVDEQGPQAPAESAPEKSLCGDETVLVVEDEDQVRQVVCRSLRRCGYFVIAARDGLDAEDQARLHGGRIHLLLTDVVLPRSDGKEVAQRLAGKHPGLRVLFMSGYAESAVSRNGAVAPGIHFIAKPFSQAALAQMVRKALSRVEPVPEPSKRGLT